MLLFHLVFTFLLHVMSLNAAESEVPNINVDLKESTNTLYRIPSEPHLVCSEYLEKLDASKVSESEYNPLSELPESTNTLCRIQSEPDLVCSEYLEKLDASKVSESEYNPLQKLIVRTSELSPIATICVEYPNHYTLLTKALALLCYLDDTASISANTSATDIFQQVQTILIAPIIADRIHNTFKALSLHIPSNVQSLLQDIRSSEICSIFFKALFQNYDSSGDFEELQDLPAMTPQTILLMLYHTITEQKQSKEFQELTPVCTQNALITMEILEIISRSEARYTPHAISILTSLLEAQRYYHTALIILCKEQNIALAPYQKDALAQMIPWVQKNLSNIADTYNFNIQVS